MYIYIIRHGETYGNINGDGFTETDLTPKGVEQIIALAHRLKDKPISKIYSSPLIRAVKTATKIRNFHKSAPYIIDCDLLEKGTDPDYCGLTSDKILKICPDARILPPHPLGVENDDIAYNRALSFIEKVMRENDFDSVVAVVAHGTFNSYLVSAALGFPYKENFNFSHLNTGVSLVCYIEENGVIKTKLKYLNDISHLGTIHEI